MTTKKTKLASCRLTPAQFFELETLAAQCDTTMSKIIECGILCVQSRADTRVGFLALLSDEYARHHPINTTEPTEVTNA